MDEAAPARQLDHLIWALVAAVAALVLAAPLASRFYIVWPTFAAPVGACLALVMAGWFYRRWRPDARLASGLESTAQLVAFAAVGAPLSYLAAAANLPLVDSDFDAVDRAAGLDWPALLGWMNAHPLAHSVFCIAYLSFSLQATTTIVALSFGNRLVQARIFLLAFIIATLVTIAVSALLPAQGVWGHYGLTTADYPAIIPATREMHLPVFLGLRDGSVRALVAIGSEGIITFPSLHAALGVTFLVMLWPVPVLRWFGLALNVLMIAATPVDGGHYFSDVFAGIVIATLSILAARSIAAKAGVNRSTEIGSAVCRR